jgi:tetratricopeptide (TPR) repeat protein
MKRAGWIAALAVAAWSAFARGVQEELLDQARKLSQEANPFVVQANDIDSAMEERRAARREAFKRLKEAMDLYNRYLDANPSMEEKLDAESSQVNVLLFGIKKDSGLGELEKEKPLEDLPGTAAPPPAPEKGAVDGQAAELAERAKLALAAIVAFEKKHPADLPAQQRYLEKFLADFPDPSLPEYADAAQRLGTVTERIKKGFETVAKRSFDSLSGADTGEEKAILTRLMMDVNAQDDDVRRRAVRLMAATRTRSATYFLARGLFDKDEELARISREGLVAIGGPYSAENLVKLYRDAAVDRQRVAMEILDAVSKRSKVDAAAVSGSIGRFVLSNESDVAESAIGLLTRMGREGGAGLVVALDSRNPDKKVAVMQALASAKCYRVATKLAERYLTPSGADPAPRLRAAAMAALKKMGVYVVPYLIPVMRSGSGQYTTFTLNEITGERFTVNDEKRVRRWWNDHRPADAEE